MAKVYLTKCKVKRNDMEYPKGSIIEDLSDEEIERGLSEYWLEEVGTNELPTVIKNKKDKKDGKKNGKNVSAKTEREQLLEKAVDLGIIDKIADETTVEEIQKLIAEAQAE